MLFGQNDYICSSIQKNVEIKRCSLRYKSHRMNRLFRHKLLRVGRMCLCVVLLLMSVKDLRAERTYLLELGPKVGGSWLLQDPVAKNWKPQLAFGGEFRYKFNTRWALGVDGMYTDLHFTDHDDQVYTNSLVLADVRAEFNFFSLSIGGVERYARSWSPYLTAGLGVSGQSEGTMLHVFIPFGFGFKWKFAERWNLNALWQADWFMSDGVEGVGLLNDPYGVNSNMLDHDLLQTLTISLTFNFWRTPVRCYRCGN